MARMKKDGTPAKKPGPKPKSVEIPEPVNGGEWEKVETPEAPATLVADRKKMDIPELPNITLPVTYDGYTVRCIEGQYGKFYWDYEYNRLDWTSPEGEEVSLSPQGWRTFCTEVMPKVMAILGVPGDE